jgi:hypothetical protein
MRFTTPVTVTLPSCSALRLIDVSAAKAISIAKTSEKMRNNIY